MDTDVANASQLLHHIELIKLALRPSADESHSDRIAVLQAAIKAHAHEAPGALLASRLGLSETELRIVWLLGAIAADVEVRRLVNALDPTQSGDPTIDTMRRIVYGSNPSLRAMRELSDSGTLRALSIIESSDGRDLHEHRRTWALSRRLLMLLHGDLTIDSSLSSIASVANEVTNVADLAVRDEAVQQTRSALTRSRVVVCVSGMPGLGRRTLLASCSRDVGIGVVVIEATKLSKDSGQLTTHARQLARECRLLGLTPLITNIDALEADAIEILGTNLVAQVDGVVLVTSGANRPAIKWDRPLIGVDLKAPSAVQLAKLWLRGLGKGSEKDGEYLAGRYPLAPALVLRACEAAKAQAYGEPEENDIYAGIRTVLDDKLGQYARRVDVTQTWKDLVLVNDQKRAVVELIARIRQRVTVHEQWGFATKVGKGLGTAALFSGAPGTGKSMCAGLIAKELGLELYAVDTARLTSKWIGETEKNLAALFDAAEAGHAILLFDEADSLFGKRSDVKSSNDKHANQETGYLLQRMESFTGICILTSNHESAIDPAFQRRLSLHLRFDLPDADEREALWQAVIPKAAPVAIGIDFARLAERFEMSGGYIRNAVLRAAFVAADRGEAITEAHLERAARAEYDGMGKITFGRV